MKKIMMIVVVCLMLVGCGKDVVVKNIVSEETSSIGENEYSYGTFEVSVNKNCEDINDLYSYTRTIDEKICKEIKIGRYNNAVVELYDSEDNYIGNMTIQKNGKEITYDLFPIDELGDVITGIKIN